MQTFFPDIANTGAVPCVLFHSEILAWNAEKKAREAKKIEDEGIAKHGSKEAFYAFLEAEKIRIEAERVAEAKRVAELFRKNMIEKHGTWENYLQWKREDDARKAELARIEEENKRLQRELDEAKKKAKEKADREYYLAHKQEIDAKKKAEDEEKARKKKAKEEADKAKKAKDKAEHDLKQAKYKAQRAEDERKRVARVAKNHASDRRLKTDIQIIGESASGLPVYSFRYQNAPGYSFTEQETAITYSGVMAQDLLLPVHGRSDAVVVDEATGYYLVDYSVLEVDCVPIVY